MKNWEFGGKELTVLQIEQLPLQYFGFIYLIEDTKTGKFYVGKKQLNSVRKAKISKREKLATKTRKRVKQVKKQSDWFTYTGSCKELNDDIATYGAKRFRRTILELCENKRDLTYREVWWQFKLNVLEENSYNNNILGRFYRQ